MHIESFSASKHPQYPELNEDALVIVPGRAYAVVDGATDRSGRRYDGGRTSGRIAAAAVAAAMTLRFGATPAPPFQAAAVVEAAGAAIRDEYRRLGIADSVSADRNTRFNATLALAVTEATELHLLLVGDSGIRINGEVLYQEAKLLDEVTAALRVAAYRHLVERGVPAAEHEALAAAVAFRGTRHAAAHVAPALRPADIAAVEAEVLALFVADHPEVPATEFEALVQGGIMFGQSAFQNDASRKLGYSCLDGFPVPPALTRHVVLPATTVHAVELFTDGYFAPGDGIGLAAWEAAADQVEQQDPAKLNRFRSVKGSGEDGRRADDRSYLCVRL